MSLKRAVIFAFITLLIGVGQIFFWDRLPLLPQWFNPELFWMNYVSMTMPWAYVLVFVSLAGWLSANLHIWVPVATWLSFVLAIIGGRIIAERIGGKNSALIKLIAVLTQSILYYTLLWIFTTQIVRWFPASTPLPIIVLWQYGLPTIIVHTCLLAVWALRRRPYRQGRLL